MRKNRRFTRARIAAGAERALEGSSPLRQVLDERGNSVTARMIGRPMEVGFERPGLAAGPFPGVAERFASLIRHVLPCP
jgi:hypothetical protein